MAKLLVLVFPILVFGFLPTVANANCCSYGCCDCGCVALKAQKNASYIAKSIQNKLGKGSSVNAFSVDVGTSKTPGKWVCTAAQNGTNCSRQ